MTSRNTKVKEIALPRSDRSRSLLFKLIVFITAVGALTLTRMAFGSTGTVLVRGTVLTSCSLTVTPSPTATALNLSTSGTFAIGTLAETCNNANGYTITASSQRNGSLANEANVNLKIPYTFSIQDGSANIALTTAAKNVRVVSSLSAPVSNVSKSLSITTTNPTSVMGGTYSDSISLTLTAN